MVVEGRLLVIVLIMVHLLAGSGIQEARYPLTHKWDTLVRKHFEKYQELIDANTYRLQRIQRGYLVISISCRLYHIPSTTTQNCLLSPFFARNNRLERQSKPKLIITKLSILVLQLISTELSALVGTFHTLDQLQVLAFSPILLTSTSQFLLALCLLLFLQPQIGFGTHAIPSMNNAPWIS